MNNTNNERLLGGISTKQFLQEYWQKKPLLIRGALPNYQSPIDAAELAGLACEEEVESRIVLEKGGDEPWQLRCGPFVENDFTQLPDSHWTLLLQEANKHIPELTPLLEKFNFIPSWLFDDIMISYAPDQGTVGPHFDRYDVFLLQVEGEKRWQISTQPVADDNYLDEVQLRIMKQFNAEADWLLKPGDMLYLPPGVAHHGVAMGDSLTFSIGYRALSQSEIFSSFSDYVLEHIDTRNHYSDAKLTAQNNSGEISQQTISNITDLLKEMPLDNESVTKWFGQFITEPRNPLPDMSPDEAYSTDECIQELNNGNHLLRNEHSRFNFSTGDTGNILLFVDGKLHDLSATQREFVELICNQAYYSQQQLAKHLINDVSLSLLCEWLNDGSLYFSGE